jgi:hypothetical protein
MSFSSKNALFIHIVRFRLDTEQGILEGVSGNFLCDSNPYEGFSDCTEVFP